MSFIRRITVAAVSLVALLIPPAQGQTPTASGVVFEDLNANGRMDPGEPPVEGVLVTNGVEVVATDARGRYILPIDERRGSISVVKPAGYATPIDDLNLPRFYYLHRPEGSPDEDFRFKGIAPTGPLPDTIDFPLTRVAEPERYSVILVADPQPYNPQEVAWYGRTVAAEMAAIPAAFAIALGDLVGDDLDLFEPYNEMNALTGHRWHNVVGNHDLNFMAPNNDWATETYQRVYGPTDYAFAQGKALYIVLNNVHWRGFNGYRNDGHPQTGNYFGDLSESQIAFVANLLEHTPTDHLIVLSTHIPLPGSGQHSTRNLDRLLAVLSSHPNTLSLSGHTHIQRHFFLGSDDGYVNPENPTHHHYNVGTASGTWWRGRTNVRGVPHAMMRDGTPNGFAVLTVEGNRYSIRYRAAGFPDDYQMNIHAPDHASGGEAFSVNVFNGSERSRVEFRITGLTDWTPMEHDPQPDPLYAAIVEEETPPAPGRRPLSRPMEANHIWAATLPSDLTPGTHWLEVRSTDMFAQVDTARHPFRVVSSSP
ncbi:MAG: calcineurin-like phosphoesterase family protein [Phycisphaerales bacterium]|nr:calcineurin-like phosphoesterase family protein [Planctomycetota bacterium]MCH8507750.1 calcineurin-like phosphoesterase family protein [Phycisphaerales bacterium]